MITTSQIRIGLAVLAIGATGALAAGCGSSEDEIKEQVDEIQKTATDSMNEQIDAAQKHSEQVQKDIQADIDAAQAEGDVSSGGDQTTDSINRQIDAAQEQANQQIEQINGQVQAALDQAQ